MLRFFLLPNLIPTKFQDVIKFFGTITFRYFSIFYAALAYKAEHSERDFIHLNKYVICFWIWKIKWGIEIRGTAVVGS